SRSRRAVQSKRDRSSTSDCTSSASRARRSSGGATPTDRSPRARSIPRARGQHRNHSPLRTRGNAHTAGLPERACGRSAGYRSALHRCEETDWRYAWRRRWTSAAIVTGSMCAAMPGSPSILYPRFDHPAIEERYASWHTQLLLRAGGGDLVFYDPEEPASLAAAEVASDDVLVVTDPLVVPPRNLAQRLGEVLDATGAAAALPVTNEPENDKQRGTPVSPYLTLRELQDVASDMQKRPDHVERVKWDRS